MSNNHKVILYLDNLSPFSRVIQNDLKKAGVVPEIKIVNTDMDAAVEMYQLTKTNRTPVIRIVSDHEEVLVGYSEENKQKMESLLHIKLPKTNIAKDW